MDSPLSPSCSCSSSSSSLSSSSRPSSLAYAAGLCLVHLFFGKLEHVVLPRLPALLVSVSYKLLLFSRCPSALTSYSVCVHFDVWEYITTFVADEVLLRVKVPGSVDPWVAGSFWIESPLLTRVDCWPLHLVLYTNLVESSVELLPLLWVGCYSFAEVGSIPLHLVILVAVVAYSS